MGQYKFLDSRYIDNLLRGQLRFGRLIYYRLLEVVTKDQWIGDTSEGLALTKIQNLSITPAAPNPLAQRRLEEARIVKMVEGSSVNISNCTFVNEVDCFVFCFSQGDLKHLKDIMCDPVRPDYAYDGCVSLPTPEALARAVLQTGIVDGRPVGDKFIVSVGAANYELAAHDFLKDGVAPANPFKKDRRYIAQQEARIVLIPREPIQCDFVSVTIASPSTLFREQFRCLPLAKEAVAERFRDERSLPDLFNILSAALRAWDGSRSPWISAAPLDLPSDEWIAAMRRESDDRERAFDERRGEADQAYWTLRKTFPDMQLDRDVARSAK
uniref:hypothetical protein n=1 Tax=Rhodopila sp. TaxID=2480087 RepID=UPI003D10CAAB